MGLEVLGWANWCKRLNVWQIDSNDTNRVRRAVRVWLIAPGLKILKEVYVKECGTFCQAIQSEDLHKTNLKKIELSVANCRPFDGLTCYSYNWHNARMSKQREKRIPFKKQKKEWHFLFDLCKSAFQTTLMGAVRW